MGKASLPFNFIPLLLANLLPDQTDLENPSSVSTYSELFLVANSAKFPHVHFSQRRRFACEKCSTIKHSIWKSSAILPGCANTYVLLM